MESLFFQLFLFQIQHNTSSTIQQWPLLGKQTGREANKFKFHLHNILKFDHSSTYIFGHAFSCHLGPWFCTAVASVWKTLVSFPTDLSCSTQLSCHLCVGLWSVYPSYDIPLSRCTFIPDYSGLDICLPSETVSPWGLGLFYFSLSST